MKVTMADIAVKLGISPSTVSRALSAPERVNTETRDKILDAARELGYTSTRANRETPSEPIQAIGLIVPDIANPFFPPIIKAIQARAQSRGNQIILADTDEHPYNEIRSANRMHSNAAGLIVVSSRMNDEQLGELAQRQPVVLLNRSSPGIPSVTIENSAGMFEAVEHLAALGHQTIAYLNGPRRSWSNDRRQEAVRQACKDLDVKLLEFGPFEPQIQAGVRAADLVQPSEATAVIAYDDMVALGVITRLNERGIKVGPELSVIGIDDSPLSGMAYPSLTSIQVPGSRAGTVAVDMLLDLIDSAHGQVSPHFLQTSTQLETRLVVRNSTAPPMAR